LKRGLHYAAWRLSAEDEKKRNISQEELND